MSDTRLLEAYRRFHADTSLPSVLTRRASAPLLVEPGEDWFDTPSRLLIVGQETNGWTSTDKTLCSLEHFHERADAVGTMLAAYSDFDFAATYQHRNSAFWRAFRFLRTGHAVLWTNLFRTDVDGSVMQNCCASEWRDLLRLQGTLLREEVDALAPTKVLFLTGPRYDGALQEVFADASFEPLWPDIAEREVAVVKSVALPQAAVRIYHPSYLQRSRRWQLLTRLSEWLNERVQVPEV